MLSLFNARIIRKLTTLLARTVEQNFMVLKQFVLLVGSDLKIQDMTALIAVAYFEHEAKRWTINATNKDLSISNVDWKWGVKYLGMPKETPLKITEEHLID